MASENYHYSDGYGSTLGAILIGAFLTTALYGNTCTLMLCYFRRHSPDHWIFKLTVLLLWALTTVSVCLFTHAVYFLLVLNYDNPEVVGPEYLPWSLLSQSALVGVLQFLVRAMFARRLWGLSRRNVAVAVSVISLSAANLVALTLVTVDSIKHATDQWALRNLDRFLEIAFGTSVAADVALTGTLCYYLYKSRTHFGKTDSVIAELALYTFNTGLLVVVDIVLSMVLFMTVSKPNGNLIFIPTYIVSGGLYLNSFLVSLNARDTFREKLTGTSSEPTHPCEKAGSTEERSVIDISARCAEAV